MQLTLLPLPKQTLLQDNYKITGYLGQGGFGITYKGIDIFLERPVAIKEFFPQDIAARMPDQKNRCPTIGRRY